MSKYNVKKLYASKNRTILLEWYFIWIKAGGGGGIYLVFH
jgi:hypothetical protein